MIIGIDIRPFLRRETGVGIYLKNLLLEMAKIDSENMYLLFSSSLKERFDTKKIPPFQNRVFKDLRIPVQILNKLWNDFSFPGLNLFFKEKPDLTHSATPLLIPGGKKSLATIYDLGFIDEPGHASEESLSFFKKNLKKSLEKCDGLIAISEFTKDRLTNLFGEETGEKTRVINLASGLKGTAGIDPGIVTGNKFILTTGTSGTRKNLKILIKALSIIREEGFDLNLVIAGSKNEYTRELEKEVSKLKLTNSVIFTGYLESPHLKYLYENCFALVFPSLYEGFGIPVLEAAECGKPSIVSDIRVFRELFKDYPVYFQKNSPEDLSESVKLLINNPGLHKKKCSKAKELSAQFNWKKCAEETLRFYRDIAG